MKSKMHEFQKKIKTSSKTNFFLLLAIFFIAACSCGCTKDADKGDPIFALPPETQVGANTFGVTINGKVYLPRDPTGTLTGTSSSGLILWSNPTRTWYEIEMKDGKSAVGFQMFIHMQPLLTIGSLNLFQSNFRNNIDSPPFTHIYFKIWDNNISNYAYYGSIENQGILNITKLSNGIIAGNFKGKFVRNDNPNNFITIIDGRFDINSFTLSNTTFP